MLFGFMRGSRWTVSSIRSQASRIDCSMGKSQAPDAPLARRQLVHGEQDGRGGVDGHGGGNALQRDPLEQLLHVGERPDRDADLADFAFRLGIVGVEPELGGEIERQREAGLALLEEVAEAPIRLARSPEPRVLAHRPQLAQVHAAVDAARVGELARRGRRVAQVLGAVDGFDLDSAARLHGRYAFLSTTSSRVISSTTSPRWFLPRRRNFTTPAWPGLSPGAAHCEMRGSSSLFASTVLSAKRVSPANTGFRWRPSS